MGFCKAASLGFFILLLSGQTFAQNMVRGNIYDRKGSLLAGINKQLNVYINPLYVANNDVLFEKLSMSLKMKLDSVRDRLEKQKESGDYSEILVKADITKDEYQKLLKIASKESSKMFIEERSVRIYPHRNLASHILGFMRRTTEDDIVDNPFLTVGELSGFSGIEKELDYQLSEGADVYLSIDKEFQEACTNVLGNHRGAIVALDPRSGKIYAMVSQPSYNPTDFLTSDFSLNLMKYKDTTYPLLNRAAMGQYMMGSTFKVITTLASLNEGITTRDSTHFCTGTYQPVSKSRLFNCHIHSGHGQLNLVKAIGESCNVYFYNVAQKTGVDAITEMASLLGLGEKAGFLLPEANGLVPDSPWREENHYDWYVGHTLLLGIGQGPMLATPLQVAQVFQRIANKGIYYNPQILNRVEYPSGPVEEGEISENDIADHFPEGAFDIIHEGMNYVVTKGTAHQAFEGVYYSLAGKTGTAEYPRKIRDRTVIINDTWFCSFAPLDNPEIVLVVLVEEGNSGGETSAPIARKILDQFFNNKQFDYLRQPKIR